MEFSVLRKLRFSVPENRVISIEKQSRQTIRRFKSFFFFGKCYSSKFLFNRYLKLFSNYKSKCKRLYTLFHDNRDFDFSCEKYGGGS